VYKNRRYTSFNLGFLGSGQEYDITYYEDTLKPFQDQSEGLSSFAKEGEERGYGKC